MSKLSKTQNCYNSLHYRVLVSYTYNIIIDEKKYIFLTENPPLFNFFKILIGLFIDFIKGFVRFSTIYFLKKITIY